jgi:predicted nucleic acid-binding protein
MDAVEHGESFTVTRDGHRIGELIPLRRRRRFVPRQEFVALSHHAPAISAITLAELSAGLHEVRRNDEQDRYDEHAERARRLEILQRVENEFDPVAFDVEAARIFGRVTAAVIATGRKPRGRVVDLMIAATAITEGLPLYTTNPDDFAGLGSLLPIMPVTRPPVPHERATQPDG